MAFAAGMQCGDFCEVLALGGLDGENPRILEGDEKVQRDSATIYREAESKAVSRRTLHRRPKKRKILY